MKEELINHPPQTPSKEEKPPAQLQTIRAPIQSGTGEPFDIKKHEEKNLKTSSLH